MKNETTPDRRALLGLGAAAAGAVLVGGKAAAQQPAGLPDLYPGLNARQFRSFQAHENVHVDFIITTIQSLGGTPRPRPTFQNLEQPDIRTFGKVTQSLENTGTGAYVGAGPSIYSRQVLDGALSIAEIEARHSGYINSVFNGIMTQNVFQADAGPDVSQRQDFERPLTQDEVVRLASPFIASLNGGPAFAFSPTPSRTNDIAILNFALVLEYLERDFYNINVPKFFPS